MHNQEIKTWNNWHITYSTTQSMYNSTLNREIYSKIQSEVTDPTIHQAKAGIVVLNNKNQNMA